jgi:hypothetical protein
MTPARAARIFNARLTLLTNTWNNVLLGTLFARLVATFVSTGTSAAMLSLENLVIVLWLLILHSCAYLILWHLKDE